MTETVTVAEGVGRVFIAVDHANSEVVGIHASKSGNRLHTSAASAQASRLD
nr:hypothetical protein [Azospirillum agricola]